MRPLTDFIVEIPNVADPDFLETVLTTVPDSQWRTSEVGEFRVDTTIRDCSFVLLRETIFQEHGIRYARAAFDGYREKFPELSVSTDTGYELLKYGVGGHYSEHVDSFAGNPRVATMSITLNDDFEGGEWSFFGGEYVIKPKARSAIVFPSNFMFPHAILPITKGTRYSLITWYL